MNQILMHSYATSNEPIRRYPFFRRPFSKVRPLSDGAYIGSGLHGETGGNRTVPPSSNLRTAVVPDLYALIPDLIEDIQLKPRPSEPAALFLARLRSSTTPEEGVTFAAYALQPRIAVWWAQECLSTLRDYLTPLDLEILDHIRAWARDPSEEMRNAVLDHALDAPSKTPGVWLGLATGASENTRADNNRLHGVTTPRAVNAGVLSGLARGGLQNRSVNLARFITMAQTLVGG